MNRCGALRSCCFINPHKHGAEVCEAWPGWAAPKPRRMQSNDSSTVTATAAATSFHEEAQGWMAGQTHKRGRSGGTGYGAGWRSPDVSLLPDPHIQGAYHGLDGEYGSRAVHLCCVLDAEASRHLVGWYACSNRPRLSTRPVAEGGRKDWIGKLQPRSVDVEWDQATFPMLPSL